MYWFICGLLRDSKQNEPFKIHYSVFECIRSHDLPCRNFKSSPKKNIIYSFCIWFYFGNPSFDLGYDILTTTFFYKLYICSLKTLLIFDERFFE